MGIFFVCFGYVALAVAVRLVQIVFFFFFFFLACCGLVA